jgi:hypothetical protein
VHNNNDKHCARFADGERLLPIDWRAITNNNNNSFRDRHRTAKRYQGVSCIAPATITVQLVVISPPDDDTPSGTANRAMKVLGTSQIGVCVV